MGEYAEDAWAEEDRQMAEDQFREAFGLDDRGTPKCPKFKKVFCSQCGGEFGPRDSGYSHCDQHRGDK